MIKVLLVEDNDTIRNGLALLIDGTEGYKCIGDYTDCESMLNELDRRIPDILLMDIGLPGMSGIEGVKIVQNRYPEVNILMLSIYEESELVFQALCAGACGYLVKKTPPSQLLEAIRDAFNGGSPMSSHIARKVVNMFKQKELFHNPKDSLFLLTTREKEILNGLADGKTYQAVALSLHISLDTVRFHIRNIYKKLHVHSVSEAVAKAIRKGIL
ncbi:response regulator transcription factor [candidate division KSB1 bacterium]|nr:response regulator transcription factor [candidate division KSB1 bacterium]